MCEFVVLFDGYSIMNDDDTMDTNCTCTLIKGSFNIVVDTMTAWDSEKIKSALQKHQISPPMIDYVISTHGHSDHIGNNNMFLNAKHIVGFSISFKDKYFIHQFDKGEEYIINDYVKIIPTPGHTLSDITVLIETKDNSIVAITGDLFEKYEDIDNPNIWKEAGSEDHVKQMINRSKIADIADWIVPGHGSKFKVTDEIRSTLRNQITKTAYIS